MTKNAFFHLDCNPIIPECGYQCQKCIKEIRSVLKAKNGIFKVSVRKNKDISGIAVEYDPETISIKDLIKELENLPSFYTGFFVLKLIEL
jgi:copper chaperone CopZ